MAQRKLNSGTRQFVREYREELVKLLSEASEGAVEAERTVSSLQSQLEALETSRQGLEVLYSEFDASCMDVQNMMVHMDHQIELAKRNLRSAETRLQEARLFLEETKSYVEQQSTKIRVLD